MRSAAMSFEIPTISPCGGLCAASCKTTERNCTRREYRLDNLFALVTMRGVRRTILLKAETI